MRFSHSKLAAANSVALLSVMLVVHPAVVAGQIITLRHAYGNSFEVVQDGHPLIGVHRLHVRPGFGWPRSSEAAYVANKLPKKQILAFLASGLGWPANDMPGLGEFRFALLGPNEACLVARWYLRDAALQEVICPAAGGGYWDTSLSHSAPGPLAWYVADLKGDGDHEVISSGIPTGAYAAPPIYWYTIYSFRDGLPRDVSSEFPWFYRAAFLPQLSAMDRVLEPPQMAHAPPPKWAPYESMVLRFTRLKFERKILGEKDAGLEQGLVWVKSPYIDVQGLGVETLGEIPNPQSTAALRALGAKTKNLGICVGVADVLAVNGAISDAEHTKRTLECDTLKPTQPCLLQGGCVPPSADETK